MDPLSDIFALVGLRSARCTRFEAGGAWSLTFPAKPALKFAAVLRGECWLAMPDSEPQRLRTGDTFLLANAPAYVLATDLDLPPQDGFVLFDEGRAAAARHGGGGETLLLGGAFQFEEGAAQRWLGVLPPFFLIPSQEEAAVLRSTLLNLDGEIGSDRMGASLMVQRLAEILLVQALRAFAAKHGGTGWLGALRDGRIGEALRSMHGDVARAWTVETLAREVGMSRSAFAQRFGAIVGETPMSYLARWRMELAREALRQGGVTLEVLAGRFGYGSDSAFGQAFKRTFGRAPKRYWATRQRPCETDAKPAGLPASAGPG